MDMKIFDSTTYAHTENCYSGSFSSFKPFSLQLTVITGLQYNFECSVPFAYHFYILFFGWLVALFMMIRIYYFAVISYGKKYRKPLVITVSIFLFMGLIGVFDLRQSFKVNKWCNGEVYRYYNEMRDVTSIQCKTPFFKYSLYEIIASVIGLLVTGMILSFRLQYDEKSKLDDDIEMHEKEDDDMDKMKEEDPKNLRIQIIELKDKYNDAYEKVKPDLLFNIAYATAPTDAPLPDETGPNVPGGKRLEGGPKQIKPTGVF